MSSAIREVVDRMYRDHIGLPPEWTAEQRRLFVDRETSRLSLRVAELAAQMGETAVTEWTRRAGREPDYPTTVGLLNNATAQATEIVLTDEVYSQVNDETAPDDPADLIEPVPDGTVNHADPDRWRTPYRSEPTAAVAELVARVWPTRSDWFTIKAEYLLQARWEDGLALPEHPDSALAHELARLVEDDLRADGLPQ